MTTVNAFGLGEHKVFSSTLAVRSLLSIQMVLFSVLLTSNYSIPCWVPTCWLRAWFYAGPHDLPL